MSPHLNTIPATALPLSVFTLSSFDCGHTARFYFSRVPGLSPSEAELNTAPTGLEECFTGTLTSQSSQMLQGSNSHRKHACLTTDRTLNMDTTY